MIDLTDRIEIPFNFRDDYLDYIKDVKSQIRYIYCSPYITDGWHARTNGGVYIPDNWQEYSRKITELIDEDFKVFILLQDTYYNDMTILNKYLDIGVTGFITSSDDLASYIKTMYPDIIVICSITKLLSYKDICNDDLSMYDAIVLNFPFERGLDAIKLLPSRYKYHMIINNNGCIYNCSSQKYHWSNGKNADIEKLSCRFRDDIDRRLIFYPLDLEYFDKYIDVFKLQGREYSSQIIYNLVMNFKTGNNNPCQHSIAYFNDAIKDGTLKIT